ncbi:MAG: glycosyltransferase, partial [Ferruginibacter sp.]
KIDYPEEKLKIIFITDGSSDSTPDIVSKYARVQLLHQPQREGKVAAINRAMQFVKTPLVIFCDANTYLNRDCVKNIVRHYIDPKVAAVSGEKKIANINTHEYAASAGEGLYWKYESFLKTLDSQFYTVVGAAGELFSVRTSLFQPVDKRILLDDFYISMKLCEKGYRVVYEPEAFSTEAPSFSIKDEQIRKVRNGAGGIQAILLLLPLLNIFKYGKLSFQYISHRVLRWIVCPPILPLILILNIFIWYFTRETVYAIILLFQIGFYLAAFTGYLFTLKNIKVKLLYVPYYFVFINVAMYLGFIRYIKKTQSVLWDKAKRV